MNRLGPMRYRITVQERTTTTNSRGERVETWSDLYSDIPASLRYLTAREQQAAGARQSEVTVAFEMWASNVPNLSGEHRIVYAGDNYELEPPTFHGRQLEFVEVKAMKGPTDG